jgi:phosphoribosylanthranilate isomerase
VWNKGIKYTRIKLCCFECLDAAYEASSIGADALGFHILQSNTIDLKDKVQRFKSFFEVLPSNIDKTLLIDFPFDIVKHVLTEVPFDSVQLYPDWEPNQIDRLRLAGARSPKVIKVMSAQSHENNPVDDREFLERYAGCVDAILLDSFREGGTGELADLAHCAKIIRLSSLPVFLAGGLNSANVAERIRTVRPFGVDVESGVSDTIAHGWMVKNLRKCREFVDAVVRTDRELVREEARWPQQISLT